MLFRSMPIYNLVLNYQTLVEQSASTVDTKNLIYLKSIPEYTCFDLITGLTGAISTGGYDIGLYGDDVVSGVTLPFDFSFYGYLHDTIYISTNGYLSFTTPSSNWNNTTLPSGFIFDALCAFWGDLNIITPPYGIFTLSGGTVPYRYFSIRWYCQGHLSGLDNNFEIGRAHV